jgi:hypothetical protein
MSAGTWQHWRYAAAMPPRALRALFAPPAALAVRLEREYGPLANCAAVHVRRGDYLESGPAAGVDMSYFEAALRRLETAASGPLPCLLVASDDIVWARAQPGFAARGARFVSGEDEVATFYLLLAARRGLICPNSTFCWWAAFLGRGDDEEASARAPPRYVIMPRPWWSFASAADDAFFYSGVDSVNRSEWVPA